MRRIRMTALYAAAHFLVDFTCALFVFRFARRSPQWLTAVLLYNFCAFALQAPLGLLADRLGHGRAFAAGGCLLTAASALLRQTPVPLCLAAGVGNALFHIGGGRDVLCGSRGHAGMLGLFVSPGALGLFLGRMLCDSVPAVWPAALLLCLCAAGMLLLCPALPGGKISLRPREADTAVLPALFLLFLVVCLRSWGGFLFRFGWKQGAWLWVSALCVALGKAAGGLAADRLGPARTARLSLLPAALLFPLSAHPLAGCLAVLLFNMTMPLTLRLAADRLPGAPGFSFGLMTLALFLGFLPVWVGVRVPDSVWLWAGLCLASLALMLPALRRRQA